MVGFCRYCWKQTEGKIYQTEGWTGGVTAYRSTVTKFLCSKCGKVSTVKNEPIQEE